MKIKLNAIFSAALVTATALSTMAATPTPMPAATPATNSASGDIVTQLFGDPVIAKGNGFEIKRSQLDEAVDGLKASLAARGQPIPADQMNLVEGKFLDRMIEIQLLLQKATPADKAEGKKKTDEQIAELLKRAGSKEHFEQQLKAVGMTEEQLRSKMNDEVTAMVTLQREVGATPTDAEIKAYYKDHPANFEQPETIRVRHILLLTMDPKTKQPLSDSQKEAKHKQAEDILKKARSGEDFAGLAEKYSEDPGSKDQGGELPPFDKDGKFSGGQMVPEFADAAFSLTNHQISDVVTTQYGYHIIQSLGKTPAKKLTLSDTLPGTDETVTDRLKDVLAGQKMETLATPYLDKLKKNGGIKILDPKLKAAVDSAEADAEKSASEPTPVPVPAPGK